MRDLLGLLVGGGLGQLAAHGASLASGGALGVFEILGGGMRHSGVTGSRQACRHSDDQHRQCGSGKGETAGIEHG